jgi:hypothetical protein
LTFVLKDAAMIVPYAGPPMDLANMHSLGVRDLFVTCLACGHEADVNVDRYPDRETVPLFANRWP